MFNAPTTMMINEIICRTNKEFELAERYFIVNFFQLDR